MVYLHIQSTRSVARAFNLTCEVSEYQWYRPVFCKILQIQSNLSNSKLKGPPKKNRIIHELELGKLCSKLEWVKGPMKKLLIIHDFELYKFDLDKFDCTC